MFFLGEISNTCYEKMNYNTLLLHRQLALYRAVNRDMARTVPLRYKRSGATPLAAASVAVCGIRPSRVCRLGQC